MNTTLAESAVSTEASDGTTTTYLVDGNNPTGYAQILEELNGASLRKSYTLGLDVISQFEDASYRDTFVYDGHGSTRVLIRDNAGNEIYDYDAYGNAIGFEPATASTSILYSGEQTDASGRQYLRARYYDPGTGRFNRLDDFEGNDDDPQSLHKYLYVGGDPILFADPSGRTLTIASTQATISVSATHDAQLKARRFLRD